ncbi:ribose/xylose/arabinose/galactoside ABC-type transport system permease subunit [Arthrobacter sp. UYP6]|uniref:ABC transporter permease n=1 Tax=Arthrobacter sp. UYP6 TaxID=1756378 RepID=UPI0033921B2B
MSAAEDFLATGLLPKAPLGPRLLKALVTQRTVLLAVLLVLVVAVMSALSSAGYMAGEYNADYMSAALINAVPLTMLALAELVVILSGRGGIDLSVGAIVSLTGMVFGFTYGLWEFSLPVSILAAVVFGALCGAVNGVLVAYLGFPPLIATLASFYAFKSLAVVINNQRPISTPRIQDFYATAKAVELPVIGHNIPNIPLGIFTFLIPAVLCIWFLLARTAYGRRIFAVGTNNTAAQWAGIDTRRTRFGAYLLSGVLSGLVAVVTVAQFASARPDAGVSGNGMALPAITIAVLGGVAITGGIGRVSGVVLAALLIVWLNAGLLLLFAGNTGAQIQLFALGTVLILAALLNGIATRRYGGTT